jgi:hypothetical protein
VRPAKRIREVSFETQRRRAVQAAEPPSSASLAAHSQSSPAYTSSSVNHTGLDIDPYESMTTGDGGRWLRQPGRFIRWRPDRSPEDCRLEQLATG